MSYATYDFTESLQRVQITAAQVKKVIAAWGGGDGAGEDSGPGWSAEGVSDWAGGFLLKLVDGRFAYIQGWCDYTGWGCQDGAEVQYYDKRPRLKDVKAPEGFYTEPHDWDESPADLNLWLKRGGKDPYE